MENYSGALQTDGYAAYNIFEGKENVTLLAFMTHANRYFDEAKNSDNRRAIEMLTLLQPLYNEEKVARDSVLNPEERMQLRFRKI